jgi:hypothetical protein
MAKGFVQTGTRLGIWQRHLQAFPFDLRRAYAACGVAAQLVGTTLLGRPAKARGYRFGAAAPHISANPAHAVFLGGR